MVKRIRGTSQKVIAASKRLRLNPTPAEEKLWRSLHKRQLDGLKFRRQHPIDTFIVDFYCPKYRLIIEVDGDSHNQKVDYDAARTQSLKQRGYRVLRFRNEEIFHQLNQVLKIIKQAAQEPEEFTQNPKESSIDTPRKYLRSPTILRSAPDSSHSGQF